MTMAEKMLDIKEYARKYHYDERTIRQYCIDGKIKGALKLTKDSRKWLIPESALQKLGKTKPYEPNSWLTETKRNNNVWTPEEVNLARSHDIRIFEKSDAILSEEDIEIALGMELEAAGFIGHSEKSALTDFHAFFSFGEETNKYINLTLRSLSVSVCQKLVELEPLIHYLFIEGSIYDGDGKEIHGFILKDAEPPEHIRQLKQLSASCRAAYSAYRAAVRETLYI